MPSLQLGAGPVVSGSGSPVVSSSSVVTIDVVPGVLVPVSAGPGSVGSVGSVVVDVDVEMGELDEPVSDPVVLSPLDPTVTAWPSSVQPAISKPIVHSLLDNRIAGRVDLFVRNGGS